MCTLQSNLFRFQLVSGSADNTIKIWNVMRPELPILTLDGIHDNKVQTMQLLFSNSSLLLTAGYDSKAAISDIRQSARVSSFKLEGEAENCAWNPFDENIFSVSTENGLVHCFDMRRSKKALFTIPVSKKACSSVSYNQKIPNLLLSSSLDGNVCTFLFSYINAVKNLGRFE